MLAGMSVGQLAMEHWPPALPLSLLLVSGALIYSSAAVNTVSTTCFPSGPPQVTITPPSSSTNEFSSAVFICTATEFTQPTISWYSNIGGSQVMLTASSSVNIQQSTSGDQYISTLTLVSAARTDAGQYVCSVTSQLANATATASLTVYCEYIHCVCVSECHCINDLLVPSSQLLLPSTSSLRI